MKRHILHELNEFSKDSGCDDRVYKFLCSRSARLFKRCQVRIKQVTFKIVFAFNTFLFINADLNSNETRFYEGFMSESFINFIEII